MTRLTANARAKASMAVRWVLANVSLRDTTILLALALVWVGLAAIYRPLAPAVIGAFLLWYTTIRRVAP